MKTAIGWIVAVLALTTLYLDQSRSPRIAGPETPDAVVAVDTVIAFGDAKCGPCRRNKPTLYEWQRSGRYNVIFLEGWLGRIPVPFYVVVREGKVVAETNNIQDLN